MNVRIHTYTEQKMNVIQMPCPCTVGRLEHAGGECLLSASHIKSNSPSLQLAHNVEKELKKLRGWDKIKLERETLCR